ncbi:uncharacterized protein LOC114340427 isoform X2 [Diabrotica virgifera virgifera]|uniref:Uncharacterized protein LOC114340427 isoform X2 n=1 Tax=Diabrotica virgifera virgifera TaxID=50390 RepID=A0A6P7GT53_DIAVI|nr:uncharacterized protein LOC114340427 isoform X2 [Diabrotica virgifera virgifera]
MLTFSDTCQTNSDINKPKIDLDEDDNEKEKIDQSQQTTPTSPNSSDGKDYMLESSVDEDQMCEENMKPLPAADSPVMGILKGGKLWRQQSGENPVKPNEPLSKTDSISDEESNPRTVRFIEEEKQDSCKASPETDREVEGRESTKEDEAIPVKNDAPNTVIEPTEMMLTFKLGNHVLISNNSLKPNSAVRQLFPCTKSLPPKTGQEDDQQYLVTAESLKAFEEAKRSKLSQMIQNAGTTDTIKRVIERNTLRRSLVRYEPKSKKNLQKTDNSLVERIKQLTCDIDDVSQDSDDLSARVSPTGEEGNNMDTSQLSNKIKEPRNFSPSSSSTASSNSSSTSSTYKRITDIFGKRDKNLEMSPQSSLYEPKAAQTQTLPDVAGPYNQELLERDLNKPNPPYPANPNDGRKQFLSTLAPLTACVSGMGHPDDHYYHLSNHGSVISSTGSEYTLDDIDEALVNEENKKIAPDVLAGTPASESGDELVAFVQQDANRIERIKKKYDNDKKEDDENDDYGFNHRPSVRGIKPRFGSTTEILQQIQNQIQLPPTNTNVSWPYYSETGLNRDEDSNRMNVKPTATTQYQNMPDEAKVRGYQYRPVSLHENYQSCANQNCCKDVYKAQVSVELDCHNLQKYRSNRPLSPPPQEISRTYHQTMVYIPYNNIESYQQPIPSSPYQTNEYYRYNQNQINKKYIEPIYQQKMPMVEEQYCNTNGQKVMAKPPYPTNYQPMMVPSRSESPLMSNYSMARSTQTSVGCMSGCSFYQVPTLRFRDSLRLQYKPPDYVNKVQRHSFPSVRSRYNTADAPEHSYVDESSIQHSNHLNGYYNYLPPKDSPAGSPTKARFIERGVPEGAASVSPQDSVSLQNSSTNTSPTSMSHTTSKPLFYAMNV